MQHNQAILAPTLSPVNLTHLCALYLQAVFHWELTGRSSQLISATILAPIMLPCRLVPELASIAKTLADAFLNPGKRYRSLIYQ